MFTAVNPSTMAFTVMSARSCEPARRVGVGGVWCRAPKDERAEHLGQNLKSMLLCRHIFTPGERCMLYLVDI